MAGTVRMEQQRQSRGETERRNPYPRTGRRMSLGNRGRTDKIVPFHRTGRLIFSMQAPVRDEQVKEIADIMEQGIVVLLNLQGCEYAAARRILDFLAGAAYAGEYEIIKIARNTYMIVPPDVEVCDMGA